MVRVLATADWFEYHNDSIKKLVALGKWMNKAPWSCDVFLEEHVAWLLEGEEIIECADIDETVQAWDEFVTSEEGRKYA